MNMYFRTRAARSDASGNHTAGLWRTDTAGASDMCQAESRADWSCPKDTRRLANRLRRTGKNRLNLHRYSIGLAIVPESGQESSGTLGEPSYKDVAEEGQASP